ncbi:hypothetical protein Trydic_g2611 [Trypoxylus dichotomus]
MKHRFSLQFISLQINNKVRSVYIELTNCRMAEEPIRRRQGVAYSLKEKQIVVNVFKYFRKLYPEKSVSQIVACTSEATGTSTGSIYMFRKEDASIGGLKEYLKKPVKRRPLPASALDNTMKEAVRDIIYTLKQNNIPPSFKFVSQIIMRDPLLPNPGSSKLRRLVTKMGYVYKKVGGTSVLVEKGNSCGQGHIDHPSWVNEEKPVIPESDNENLVIENNQMCSIKCESEEQYSDSECYGKEQYHDTELNNEQNNVILKFECEEPWCEDSAKRRL